MLIERTQKTSDPTDRIRTPRPFIQVLYGPRQVGKTTLALQVQLAGNLGISWQEFLELEPLGLFA